MSNVLIDIALIPFGISLHEYEKLSRQEIIELTNRKLISEYPHSIKMTNLIDAQSILINNKRKMVRFSSYVKVHTLPPHVKCSSFKPNSLISAIKNFP